MTTLSCRCVLALACSVVVTWSPTAGAETVSVPPVVISSLTHSFNGTTTTDGVLFPCTGDTCSGPGFEASIGQNDTIAIRFEAPAGKRFVVIKQPGGTQEFFFHARWHTGAGGGSPGMFQTNTATFENLTGTPPTSISSQHTVFSNGSPIQCNGVFTVNDTFTFTAITLEFTVVQSVPDILRAYGEVFAPFTPAFGSTRVTDGSAPDATLMVIEDVANIAVPPVVVSTLTHEYSYEFKINTTVSSDGVDFPCSGGACNGPGFTASISTDDLVTVRFDAPAGMKFLVKHHPTSTTSFGFAASWSTNVIDTSTFASTPTFTFENLTGPQPVLTYDLCRVSNNGHVVQAQAIFAIDADCSFTGVRAEFTVNHALPDANRTYGPVNTPSGFSFAAGHSISGIAPDYPVMRIVPICNGNTAPDESVGVPDLLTVINAWGQCPSPCPASCPADLSPSIGDCSVGVPDLLTVINSWGTCPP